MAELKDSKVYGDLTITGNLNLSTQSKITSSIINYITDTELNNLEVLKNIKAKNIVLLGSIDTTTEPSIYFTTGDDKTILPNGRGDDILLESTKAYLIFKQEKENKTEYQQIALDLTTIDNTMSILKDYISVYTTQKDNENIIPINLDNYVSNDVLNVFIDGKLANNNIDYTILDTFKEIKLTNKSINKGTVITFQLFKNAKGDIPKDNIIDLGTF